MPCFTAIRTTIGVHIVQPPAESFVLAFSQSVTRFSMKLSSSSELWIYDNYVLLLLLLLDLPTKKKELCTFIKFSHKPLLLSPFNLFHRHSVAQLHFLFLASIDSSSVKVKPTSSFLSRYLIGPRTIFFWLVKTQVSIILIPYSTLHLILINLNFLAAMNPGSTSTW